MSLLRLKQILPVLDVSQNYLKYFLRRILYSLGDTGTSSVLKLNLRLSKSGGPENWTKPGNAGSMRSNPDEIALLELIRGIDSQKLRQEFLRQKEPTLEGLLQIARNWQRSNDVNNNLEATTEARKSLTSSYQIK